MHVVLVPGERGERSPAGASWLATSLPKGMRALGHKVTLLAPLHRSIDPHAAGLARRLSRIEVAVDGTTVAFDVFTGRTSAGFEVTYLGNDALFGHVDKPWSGDANEVAQRLGAFARAAARFIDESDIDVAHGSGSVGAAVIAHLAHVSGPHTTARILSLDDVNDLGVFPREVDAVLGLGADAVDFRQLLVTRAGVLAADAVVVPSIGFGQRACHDDRQPGLASALAKASERVQGVMPGLDGAVWNPLTDPCLPSRFDPVDRSGKARCKSVLARELGLPLRVEAPLVGVAGSTEQGRGMRVVANIARQVLRTDALLVIHVEGSGEVIEELEALRDRWPDRIALRQGEEDAFLHRLVAASDLFVVPSDRSSSSSLVLAALRYGALPVAPREHPVADAIVDCDPELRTGTGFLFDVLDDEHVLGAIRRGAAAFARSTAFEAVQQRAMRLDHTLERAARVLDRVYRGAVEERNETPGASASL